MSAVWTDEEDASLRLRAQAGHSAAQIGRALGRSRCSVLGRALRIGVEMHGSTGTRHQKPKPRSTPDEVRSATDPNRADKLLRRFSWQEPAP